MKRLKSSLKNGSKFVITAELTGGPGFSFKPFEHFLGAWRQEGEAAVPEPFDFVGIMLPQNPGGQANIEPSDALSFMRDRDLLGELDFIPHLSCKDQNADSLMSSLIGYQARGVESILALTGDKPGTSKGVFELGAIGLLQMIRRMNNQAYMKAKPELLDKINQFFAGAAVSPFKYTEASQMQQYYKMENKVTAGAEFLITQVGWDWKKSLELMRYMKEYHVDVPVMGNVYFLTSTNPAPRLMHDIKLPGCFVSDELLAKLNSESLEQHMERAAQQIAMYRAMGAAGADVGGVHDFEQFKWILNRAVEIGTNWEPYKNNLCWPAKKAWYLYDESGKKTPLSKKKKTMRHRFFKGMHRAVLDPDYTGFKLNKGFMKLLGAHKKKGFGYKCVFCGEKVSKYLIFDCKECGDCFLPENFGLCTIGGCEKGLDNAPCGDSTVEGFCGNNLERVCIGELIYDAAGSEKDGLEKLRHTINPPRNPLLEGMSSVVNYVFAYDHTKKSPLIGIGDLLHAQTPGVGAIMRKLSEMGPGAWKNESPERNYIRAMIQSQSDDGARYILVNADALGSDGASVLAIVRDYISMVRQWSGGVPVCVESKYEAVLNGALREWYNTDLAVSAPMLHGVTMENLDKLGELKKQFDFVFMSSPAAGAGKPDPNGVVSEARKLFDAAVGKYKFKAEDIFFEVPCVSLAKDMDTEPGEKGYTALTMECIRRLKQDDKLKSAHCAVVLANCSAGLPRRIGVNRAYAAAAMVRGLDAGIMDASAHYGEKEADAKLVEMVEAFAKIQGNAADLEAAKEKLNAFAGAKKKKSA